MHLHRRIWAEQLGVEAQLSAGVPVSDTYMLANTESGVFHRAAYLSGHEDKSLPRFCSVCGWKYSLSDNWRWTLGENLPQTHKGICGKCFPREHALAKSKLAQTETHRG